MIYTWLRKLFAPTSKRDPARTFKVRPNLERLEDRTVPSNFQPAGTAFPDIGTISGSMQPAIIIKIGAGGAVTTMKTGQGPYDGSEDTYIAVVNQANSGRVVSKLLLTSTADIFGFDDDGIQGEISNPPITYTVPPSAPPGYSPQGETVGEDGYEGPGTFF